MVILALLIILLNVTVFSHIEADTNFVNQSGKLRAFMYKMAQLSNAVILSEEPDQSQFKLELNETINQYELLLDTVDNRTLTTKAKFLNYPDTDLQLKHIREKWNTIYKVRFLEICDSNDPSVIASINADVTIFVDLINEMVTSYSVYSSNLVSLSIKMNGILVFIIIVATFYSFTSTNLKIRKPMDSLIEELKGVSHIDPTTLTQIENNKQDEIAEMSIYFNEMMYDALTHVLNRRAGLSKLNQILKSGAHSDLISICFIDVNGLKQVNDVLGHKYGDELIVTSVNVIKNTIRNSDFVIRLGGDEFLIVFCGINKDQAEKVWARIISDYDSINLNESNRYLISVSHGIIEHNSTDQIGVEALLKLADETMYLEKRKLKSGSDFTVIH